MLFPQLFLVIPALRELTLTRSTILTGTNKTRWEKSNYLSDVQVGPAQPKRKRRKSISFPREGFLDLGAKMETEEPWESLDIDDSDLSNFLRPCNNRTTTVTDTPLIPGPAGAVQSAMIQRRTLGSSNILPTQEFVRHVLQNGHDTDLDFNSNPWLSASHFLQSSQGKVS